MSKIENHQTHLCFTMFFEGRGMQKQPKMYQIPNLKPSKKHSQFQARFLLYFGIILGRIWPPVRHSRARFAEKTPQDGRVI